MTAISDRALCGPIHANRSVLKGDWWGRKWEWLAGTQQSYWLSEIIGFLGVSQASAYFRLSDPFYAGVNTEIVVKNTICMTISHLGLRFFKFHQKLEKALDAKVNELANQITWQNVCRATSLDVFRNDRQALLSSLTEPLALSPEVSSAYLEVSNVNDFNEPFNGIWFERLESMTLLPKHDVNTLSRRHLFASLPTKISRDAYGFSVYVEELIRFMQEDSEKRYQVYYLKKPFEQENFEGLGISKERFLQIFDRCVPKYFESYYSDLLKVLKQNIESATDFCSDQKYLAVAIALVSPHYGQCENYESAIASLYHLIFSDEVESLFDKEGRIENVIPVASVKESLLFLEMIDVLKTKPAIEIFFHYTNLKKIHEYFHLINLQRDVIEKYDELIKIDWETFDLTPDLEEVRSRLQPIFYSEWEIINRQSDAL